MTIAYNHRISKASPLNFFRVMLRWKASIWKAVLFEVILWSISYQVIAYTYRFLPDYFQKRFQKFALNINERVKFIPLQFILGFFVNIIVKRWTDAFQNMGRIEDQVILISNIILGEDNETRMLRRTVARYLCLSQVLVLRDISIRVRRRFPTYESIIKSGYMNKDEYDKFKKYLLREDYNNGRYWVPLNWAFSLVIQARKDGKIKSDIWTAKLCDELRKFQNSMQVLCNYDWVQIPLAYPQFVYLAVHSFFIICLFGRQFEILAPPKSDKIVVHIPFPIMTILQYMCYLGWMKVAASLMNPYGEDEDDFECNYLIDKNTATALFIVDTAHDDLPDLQKDKFWEKSEVELFYPINSTNSVHHPLIGSAVSARVSKPDREPEMIVVHRPVLPHQSIGSAISEARL